jgi:hypothetical protein
MKKVIILTAICLSILVGCKKSDYNCQQKITTTMIPDSAGFPKIQYSDFQVTGNISCIIGETATKTPINRNVVKVVKYETTCK